MAPKRRSLARSRWALNAALTASLLAGSWACSGDFSVAPSEPFVRPTDHAAPAPAESTPRRAPRADALTSAPPLDAAVATPDAAPASESPLPEQVAPEQVAPDQPASEQPAPESPSESAVPEPDEAPALPPPEEIPVLVAAAREVFVYDRPSFESKKLGYLRAGARVPRSREAAGNAGCKEGFYRVAPAGYVCAATGVRLRAGEAIEQLAAVRPDRSTPLPYTYARARSPAPPLYVKLPSESEERSVEPELGARARSARGSLDSLPLVPVPAPLAQGEQLPNAFGYRYPRELVSLGRALNDSAFAILSVFQHRERRFALTADLLLVPLDRLQAVSPSAFHGVVLSDDAPLVFVLRRGAYLYSGRGSQRRPARALGYREALSLTGESETSQGLRWLETTTHDWIRDEGLVRIEAPRPLPPWAKAGRPWLSVSISKQTLVAYEGEHPVYATLVSTGVDGLGDPETTRSTVRGQYRIHTKHVSVTMDSDEVGDEYDLRDVPYVQYFHESYALHAAYWHDGFGTPRSHGCINLAPLDARWLFRWTAPAVPPSWHGAFSLRDGTLIDIVP